MPEHEWWRRYLRTLIALPETGENPVALTDLLRVAGYYEPRSGIDRPNWLPPERAALAAWNLRYATKIGPEVTTPTGSQS